MASDVDMEGSPSWQYIPLRADYESSVDGVIGDYIVGDADFFQSSVSDRALDLVDVSRLQSHVPVNDKATTA